MENKQAEEDQGYNISEPNITTNNDNFEGRGANGSRRIDWRIGPSRIFNTISLKVRSMVSSVFRSKRSIFFALASLLVIIFVIILSFKIGYDRGYIAGDQEGKNNMLESKLNDPLATQSVAFQSLVGKFVSLSNGKLEMDMANGVKEAFGISDKTRITKKGKNIAISDISKDQRLKVFFLENTGDRIATRVIVSE